MGLCWDDRLVEEAGTHVLHRAVFFETVTAPQISRNWSAVAIFNRDSWHLLVASCGICLQVPLTWSEGSRSQG